MDVGSLVTRLRGEWPAVLAIVVLLVAHVYLTIIEGEALRPIGIPLLAAVIVFILGEFVKSMT